jgi:hypothetical protein
MLTGIVVVWWLLIAAAVVVTLSPSATSAPGAGAAPIPGRQARIHQPRIEAWPVPVDRQAFDLARRGFHESDDALVDRAFESFEWVRVSHGDPVRIVTVDGEAVEVEFLDGPHSGRRGWVQPRHLTW